MESSISKISARQHDSLDSGNLICHPRHPHHTGRVETVKLVAKREDNFRPVLPDSVYAHRRTLAWAA